MLSDLRFRARALFRRAAVEAELDGELRAHLAWLIRKHEERGLPPEEAARQARLEFGGLEQVRAECRDARGVGLVDAFTQDIRYAARVLRKDLSFTLLAAITLALGVGATTAVFGVVDAVLLKPLPYHAAERLAFAWGVPPRGIDVGFDVMPWGRLQFLAFAEQSRTFGELGAFLGSSFNLTGAGEPARFDGARVSAGFFRAFRVAPRLGRVFGDDADRPGGAAEVVLSDRLWRERFGSDAAVIGRAIDVNGSPHTVVGVMPPGFTFPQSAGMPGDFVLPRESLLWAPLALSRGPRVRGEPNELAVVGRLADDLERAQAELDVFAKQMDQQFPQGKGWFRSRVVPMAQQLAGGTRRPLLLLLAAVGVLLLTACANIASLLLARSMVRAREFSVRAALGAGRSRLIAQVTTEHLVLGALGGAGGLAIAAAAIDLVKAFGPANVPRLADARIDATVLAFSIAVSLASALGFGVVPAWAAAREDLVSSLKSAGSRSIGTARGSWTRSALLVSEVALALVLVIASGLLARTLVRLSNVDAGFNPAHAMTFELTLSPASYPDSDRIVALYRSALLRLRALPGVESVGIGETVPMGGAGESTGVRIPDRRADVDGVPPYANYTILSPGYLAAVGTPILKGRDFLETDTAESLPVAIVNAAMARQYWPGQDVIGKRVGLPIHPFDMTIVGVVADVKHQSLREEPGPELYVPYTQKPWPSMLTMHLVVRTKGDPSSMIGAVRSAIHGVDPDLPLAAVATLDAIVDTSMAQPRFSMLLVSGFGGLSLVLACVGLYGAVAYSVTTRRQELGVRLALGASTRRLVALVLAHGARIAALGIVFGIALALILLKTMAGFLYGVEWTDPTTFGGLSLLLLAVALAACYVPARRAMRVDPLTAMRSE
jgi:putative ABC transport system permease protein